MNERISPDKRKCKLCDYVYCIQDNDDEYYENIEKNAHPEEFED